MAVESLSRPQRMAVRSMAVLVGLTRFVPLSRGPWDWDEVLFCLAIDKYDVAMHQPHPAGFPLFIALGRVARLFTDSGFHALQAVNVLAAFAVFPLLFRIARAVRMEFATATAAALLFAFLPNVWFYGGTAFSDLPGAVLFLAAVDAYLETEGSARRYLVAGLLLGCALLIRPQNAVVAIFPWTFATSRFVRQKRWRPVIGGALLVVAVVAIGYGAAAWVTGPSRYAAALAQHSEYVRSVDSIASADRPPLWRVALTLLDPYEAGKVSIVINLLALGAIVAGRRAIVAKVLLTFAPAFLFTLIAVGPGGAARFSLNYIAGIALLAAEGTYAAGRLLPRWRVEMQRPSAARRQECLRHTTLLAQAVLLAIILGRLIPWTLPAFSEPRRTWPPPVAAALWLKAHTSASQTIFTDGSSWPWGRYFLRGRNVVAVDDLESVLADPRAVDAWHLAVGPPPVDAIAFVRPRNRTANVVAKRTFEAYVEPATNVVKYGQGWYDAEENGIERWRWSGPTALMYFAPAAGVCELRLQLYAPSDLRIGLAFNGAPLENVSADGDRELRYLVHPRSDRTNVLRVDISRTFVPSDDGTGRDRRQLGVMLRSLVWRQVR